MAIYIEGIEMPTDCALLLKIFPDGGVGVPVHLNWAGTRVVNDAKAVPVSPHGRLIDADKLKAKQQEDADLFINAVSLAEKSRRDEALNAVANIVNAPTIIPAEEAAE